MPKLTIRRGDTTAETTFIGTPLLGECAYGGGALPWRSPAGGAAPAASAPCCRWLGRYPRPSSAEQKAGVRLACQALLWGDCEVVLPLQAEWSAIQTGETGQALGAPDGGALRRGGGPWHDDDCRARV